MKTMTITVPTDKAGEMAFFKIGFDCSLNEVLENIDLLVKPSDVLAAEKAGWWAIL